MKFSLHNQVKQLNVDVKKADLAWLNALEYTQNAKMPNTPEGWSVLEERIDENATQENSLFYCLHRRLYHKAFVYETKQKSHTKMQIPYFPPNFWPLLFINVADDSILELEDDYCFAEASGIPFRRIHVELGKNAKLIWKQYQHHSEEVKSYDSKKFVLGENSSLEFCQNIIGAGQSLDEVQIELVGKNSAANSQILFLAQNRQKMEMRMSHVHIGENTKSNIVSKGAVKDNAHANFYGTLNVKSGAKNAICHLEEHNLILSKNARIDATPALEISHDDVQASHSAKLEKINESELYYLNSRGLATAEALSLIVEGFYIDALRKMQDEAFENKIFEHILNNLK